MNILLINHYAGSKIHGMVFRHFYLAREWVKMGHQVTIVAASFSHVRTKNPCETKNSIEEEKIEGIRYLWIKTSTYQGSGLGRLINLFEFAWRLLRYRKVLIAGPKPDLVIASSPQPFIIFAARKIADECKVKLIFEVRDLWPLSLIELGRVSRFHPFILLMQLVENYAYRVSDKVVSLLPAAAPYMVKHGMDPEQFVYIANGVDLEEWRGDQPRMLETEHERVIKSLRKTGRFILGYTGSHGLANALDDLLDAAHLLRDTAVTIVLVGQGPGKSSLQQRAQDEGLMNIVFLPPIDKKDIPALLQLMDALYIGWKKEALYRFGISPNKLTDYMMAARPVIHAVEAPNDLVAESGCGFSPSPENSTAIAESIIKMMKLTLREREALGIKGRDYVTAHYSYQLLAKKYLDAVTVS